MAITFIGSGSGTTSAALPAHQAGDLIVAFAFRDGNTSAPSLPSGWTDINSSTGANSCGGRLAYKTALSSSETAGAWTNASIVVAVVYRSSTGARLLVGNNAVQDGAGASVTYPSVEFWGYALANSTVLGFAGHRSTNTDLQNAPTGMTARSTAANAACEVASHDSNGVLSGGWTAASVSVGGASSGWRAHTVEIMEDRPNDSRWDRVYAAGVIDVWSPDDFYCSIIGWEGGEPDGFNVRASRPRYPDDPHPKRVFAVLFAGDDTLNTNWSGPGLGNFRHRTTSSENTDGSSLIFYNGDDGTSRWRDGGLGAYPIAMGEDEPVLFYVDMTTMKVAVCINGAFVNDANPNTGANCFDASVFENPELGIWPVFHFGDGNQAALFMGSDRMIAPLRVGLSNESDYVAWDYQPDEPELQWDPAHKGPNIALALNNTRADFAGGDDSIVRANIGHTTGKRVFSLICNDTAGEPVYSQIGLVDETTTDFTTWLTANTGSFGQVFSGEVGGQAVEATLSPFGDGDTIWIAVDIDNRLWWSKVGLGDWNNNPAADPDAGTGGGPIPSTDLPGAILYPAVSLASLGPDNLFPEGYTFRPYAVGHALTTFAPWEEVGASGSTYTLDAAGVLLSLAGQAATLKAARQLPAAARTLALTPSAVGLRRRYTLSVLGRSLSLTGQAAGLSVGRKLAVPPRTLALGGAAIALKAGRVLPAQRRTLAVSSPAVALSIGRGLSADAVTIALDTRTVTLTYTSPTGYTLEAGGVTLELSADAIGLVHGRRLFAAALSVNLAAQDAALTIGRALQAETAALDLTGATVLIRRAKTLNADAASTTLHGSAAGFVGCRALLADDAELTLKVLDVFLDWSAAPVWFRVPETPEGWAGEPAPVASWRSVTGAYEAWSGEPDPDTTWTPRTSISETWN